MKHMKCVLLPNKVGGEGNIFYTMYCTCNSKNPFLFLKNALTFDQKHPFWGIWRTWGNFKQLPVIDLKIKKELG